jgi:hypothetical protein
MTDSSFLKAFEKCHAVSDRPPSVVSDDISTVIQVGVPHR